MPQNNKIIDRMVFYPNRCAGSATFLANLCPARCPVKLTAAGLACRLPAGNRHSAVPSAKPVVGQFESSGLEMVRFPAHIGRMPPWLKIALIIAGIFAGWLALSVLTFDATEKAVPVGSAPYK
jgi:hypothetical protein